MQSKRAVQVIARAKELLADDPFDAGHELTHHELVVSNILWIVEQEHLEDRVDIDSLLIAAWYHDYKRNQDELCDATLTDVLQGVGYTNPEIEKILAIKNSHSFGNENHESVESQILFDADKIEYVHYDPRYVLVSQAVASGKMSNETFQKYLKAFEDRIVKVSEMLHFESSRERFYEYLTQTREWLVSTNPVAGEWRPLLPSIDTVINARHS